jgi:hypothetical protein
LLNVPVTPLTYDQVPVPIIALFPPKEPEVSEPHTESVEVVTVAVVGEVTIVNAAVVEPIITGLELTTRIKKPVPLIPDGKVAAIVPELVEDKVPIEVGEAKDPLALDNSAVNTFPELKVPVAVYGTETALPSHKGPVTVPVVMDSQPETVTVVETVEVQPLYVKL